LLAAIDAREKSIADRIAEAGRREKEADARNEQLVKNAEEAENRKAALLAAARADADRERGELLSHARDEVKGLEGKWHSEIEREKKAFLDEMRRCAAVEIFAATRSALRDLACADVQCCAMNAFLEKLRLLDVSSLRGFAKEGLTVVSREEMPPSMQDAVRKALEDRLGASVPVMFERNPAMAWGVELRGVGQRIGWTPDAYLDSLEDKLSVALDRAAAESYPVAAA
jgi:F-type H+-transporting ATPase subunit b